MSYARTHIDIESTPPDTPIVVNNRIYRSWRSHRRTQIFVAIFWMMTQCEARSSGAIHLQAASAINYPVVRNSDGIEHDAGHGELYKSHSGDPWGSSSITNQKNHHNPAVPYNDTISNGTKSIPLPVDGLAGRRRVKRGVVHLYNMVVCATGCNPLAYKGYGCYCGFLGSGYVIDGIDRCCKMHDWCYDATECPMFMEYFVPYYWRCYHGHKPVCAVEHGDWGAAGSCAQRLCECDRSLAECLRHYPCPTTKAVCTSSPWRLVQNLFMIM